MILFYVPHTDTEASTEAVLGLFDDSIDKENILGIRLISNAFTEITPTISVYGTIASGLSFNKAMTTVLNEASGVPDRAGFYMFVVDWRPDVLSVFVDLYNYVGTTLTLQESEVLQISSIPDCGLTLAGFRNDPEQVLGPFLEFCGFINNTYVRLGTPLDTHAQIVDEVTVNPLEYEPTDVHILANYYDFVTGVTLQADGDLTVEILDSSGSIETTLTATRRDDGKYEAFWDSTGVTQDTYMVSVKALFNGKDKVSRKWISIHD